MLTTYLFNLIVPKLSAVYVVLLRFIGQIFTSAILDYVYLSIFSVGKVVGCVILLFGLMVNAKVDYEYEQGKFRLAD